MKEGHDGAVAVVEDGALIACLEAEKDSFPRCTAITAELLLRAAELAGGAPDVVAIGGWVKGTYSSERPSLAGYFGTDGVSNRHGRFFGDPVTVFSSTHERSHIWGAYGMAPFEAGRPCHILVWEGNIGKFYSVDDALWITDHGPVMVDPGNKYTFLYSLADVSSPSRQGYWDTSHPGKLMALAAYGKRGAMDADERRTSEFIISRDPIMVTTEKDDLAWSPFHNVGVESQAFKDLAAKFSDRIFEEFLRFAEARLERGLPLLIAGGCGLNCEWNSRWRECGLFSDVFVPPCCNDSGSAVGTAVDAMQHLTGQAKLSWTVYAGEAFHWDCTLPDADFTEVPFDPPAVAEGLATGNVVAWVEGRYEMGPRALGHRSLLAEPFNRSTRDRLNAIKGREAFRPIAPICLASQVGEEFEPALPSPHMLYFYRVRNSRLGAVTHVDGSARVQTVDGQGPLQSVLKSFRERTGSAVLCNTSLNFKGRGFINKMSDLVEYCSTTGVDEMVVDGRRFIKTTSG